MSLKSFALTTVQRAADFIGLGTLTSGTTKYTIVENLCNSVTEFIENYIGYRIKETAYSNQEYSTEKGKTLHLTRFPVSSSATFTLQRRETTRNKDEWDTVDSKYYFVDYNAGIITAAAGGVFARTINGYRVSYTAGYSFDNSTTFLSDTEAGDIEMAAWMLIDAIYNRKGGSGIGIQSEGIGDYRVSYAKELMEDESIKTILDKYKRIEVAGPLTPLNI